MNMATANMKIACKTKATTAMNISIMIGKALTLNSLVSQLGFPRPEVG